LQRLLHGGAHVTLGDETRWASGPRSRHLLRREVADAGAWPGSVELPAGAVGGRWALQARIWRGRGGAESERRAFAADVTRGSGGARAQLPDLEALQLEPPFTLELSGLPLPAASEERLRKQVRIPSGAVLDLGFGQREEAWSAEASPVRFRVLLRQGGAEPRVLLEQAVDPADPAQRRWFDARLALADWAGRRVSLELVAAREEGRGTLALPVWSDPTLYAAAAPDGRPNVVLVSVDTLRAPSLGSYGYARDTSPFLDGLAREGALFENAITTSVTTAPSHMSLFTGLYPVHHGIVSGSEWKHPRARTLPEQLRAAGYETAAFTENGFVIRARGFGDGFARYVENRARPDVPRSARRTFAQARRWLESGPRRPFFLFVHTYEVHAPYAPPAAYAELFVDDGVAGPADPVVRSQRDDYDREIRHVDDELRGLFDTLAAVEASDSTLLVFTADHGEEFGEHGSLQHGGAVFEESLRVPLVFWGPGRVPEGLRVADLVSLIDVGPTLLELLGLPPLPALDGVSLGPLLRGEAVPSRRLFAEARAEVRWIGPSEGVRWSPPLVAVRTDGEKFVVHRPAHGPAEPSVAYDLALDPGELEPRALSGPEGDEVHRLVDAYLSGRAAPGPPRSPAPAEPPDLGPELREQLRDLGYLE
jgi:arylsulfatase A-like enzyme